MIAFRSVCGLVAAVLIVPAASSSAAVIAGYNFGNTTATPTRSPNATAANVAATDVTGGSQIIFINQNSSIYTSFPFRAAAKNNAAGTDNGLGGVTGTPTGAIDRSQYYVEYTVTAASGYELDLSSASFGGSQGGGNVGERTYGIHTSVDGLGLTTTSDITSGGYVATTNGTNTFSTVRPATGSIAMPTYTADLSAAKYQDLSSFTFRLYFATPNNGQNIDVDNFILNGTVSAVAPEPTTIAALAGVALVGLRRRRA